VREAGPDLGLPAAVVVLDRRLEARLARRGEDRHDAQAQAEPGHATDDVLVLVGALEDRVVVEPGVSRQADGAPVPDQRLDGRRGGDHAHRPGGDQAAVRRGGVEHLDVRAALDDQALDDIGAVEFGPPGREVGQVPAGRRGGPSRARAAVQGPAPVEDAADGPRRGEWRDALGLQGIADGAGAELAQVAPVLQLDAEGQHEILQVLRGAVDRPVTAGGLRREVDPIEAASFGPRDPEPDGGQGDAEAACDLAEGSAAAGGGDHLTTTILDSVLGPSEPRTRSGLSSY
jgi:hypothetical protein